METKHTPGPWKIEVPNFEELTIYTDEVNICTVLRQGELEEEGEANAKLIAAAPELLEALINANTYLRATLNAVPGDGSAGGKMLSKFKNAIDKATE